MPKGLITITSGPEHADIRAAFAAIRAVVTDKRDSLRIEYELFSALVRSGRLVVTPETEAEKESETPSSWGALGATVRRVID